MIGYAFYTTEGVPLYSRGGIKNLGLVSFIDRYGIWVLYAPAVIGGKKLCYIGARFDNVKETILGRLNRVVLLIALEKLRELQNSWRLFDKKSILEFAKDSGLIFDNELRISDTIEEQVNPSMESIEKIYHETSTFIGELNGISEVPFRRVQVPGFTDVRYPSLSHRALFLAIISEVIAKFSNDTCVPSVINGLLENAWRREGDIVYPLIVYSKGSAPSLGGLWFSGG